jgi:hypothetical protein
MPPSLQLPKFAFDWFQFIEWIRPQMRALPLTSLGRHHRAQAAAAPVGENKPTRVGMVHRKGA